MQVGMLCGVDWLAGVGRARPALWSTRYVKYVLLAAKLRPRTPSDHCSSWSSGVTVAATRFAWLNHERIFEGH
jgi:hypothetical protein